MEGSGFEPLDRDIRDGMDLALGIMTMEKDIPKSGRYYAYFLWICCAAIFVGIVIGSLRYCSTE